MSESESHSADLIRLVQHVALNESGWWNQAIESLILACAYLIGPSTQHALCTKVTESSGVQENSQRLLSAIDKLIESGSLIKFNDKIRVAEEINISLGKHEKETLTAEKMAHERFRKLAYEYDLEDQIDQLWSDMETKILLPMIRHIGAHIYGLISTEYPTTNPEIGLQINRLCEHYGAKTRELFIDFIDPTDTNVRSFILRRLNAQYIIDASALPSHALDRIGELNTIPSRIDIFLDTNVLFNILDLNYNPNDNTAFELPELTHQLKGRINLKLYVLPITIEETRRVLRAVMLSLECFPGQSNLAEAARQVTQQGLVARYYEEAQRSSNRLTAQNFFGPYESDLLTILRDKSIELYNTNLEDLYKDQQVIDDTLELQRSHREEKSYETNLHDMVLWHFASRLRRTVNTSPLEISNWIVTLDYRGLISFDKQKQKINIDSLPLCLDPASLIHMFQFWIPSYSELDEALVNSLRYPLLFLNFNTESEQVTIKILEKLSRYIGAEDLAPDTVKEILINSALRERLSKPNSDPMEETDSTLLFPTIIQELNDKLQRVESMITEKNSDLEKERYLRDTAESNLSDEKELSKKALQRMSANIKETKSQITDLEKANKNHKQHIESQNKHIESQNLIIKYKNDNLRLVIGIFVTVLASIVMPFGIWFITRLWIANDFASLFIALLCSFLLILTGLDITGKETRFANSLFFTWIAKRRWWNYTISTLLSICATFITDWMRT